MELLFIFLGAVVVLWSCRTLFFSFEMWVFEAQCHDVCTFQRVQGGGGLEELGRTLENAAK